MKLFLPLILFISFFLSSVSLFDHANVQASPLKTLSSLDDKVENTQLLLTAMQKEGSCQEECLAVQNAYQFYQDGDEKMGDLAIYSYLEKQSERISKLSYRGNHLTRFQKLGIVYYLAVEEPTKLRQMSAQIFEGVLQTIKLVQDVARKNEGFIRRHNRFYQEQSEQTLNDLRGAIYWLKNRLSQEKIQGNSNLNQTFLVESKLFTQRVEGILNSLFQYYPTSSDRVEEFNEAIGQFVKTGQWPSRSLRLEQLDEREKSFERTALIFNRKNLTIAAFAALLIAELATAPVSAEAIPATATALLASIQTAKTVGSAIVLTTTSLNILDRITANGWAGVLNLQTAFDVLMVLTILPRPTPAMMTSAALGGMAGKAATFLASGQYQAGYLLLAGQTSYGAWEIYNSDKIASEYQRRNIPITSEQIRKDGIFNLSLGLLGGMGGYLKHKAYVESYGSTYSNLLESAKMGNTFFRTGKNAYSFYNPFNAFSKIRGGFTNVLNRQYFGGGLALFKGTFQLTFGLMFAQSIVLTSYTYADTLFMKRISLPQLKKGEIAVALNGFDPTDLLYYATHTDDHHREELKKYKREVNFFDVDFKSPRDLVTKLQEISRSYGKIKYLKISTHGMPGHMLTRTQDFEGEGSDYVDVNFLEKNLPWIQSVAKDAFAPDAQVVFLSCLVGANLDRPMEIREQKIPSRAGDQFLSLFGKAFLVNGGTIDSSRRILLGANGSYIWVAKQILESGQYDAKTRTQLLANLETLKEKFNQGEDLGLINQFIEKAIAKAGASDEERERIKAEMVVLKQAHAEYNRLAQELTDGMNKPTTKYESARLKEILSTLGERFVTMHLKMVILIYKYGINIDGGFFADRHRRDTFPAQADR